MRIILALLLACLSASAQLVINNQVPCTAVGISGQPTSLVNLTNVGQTLTVTASGTTPYAYQWHQGTSATNALAGATTSSYSYTNQTAVTNSYCAVVTNACGSITSSVATLAWTNGTGGGGWDGTVTNLGTPLAWWVADNAQVNTNGAVTNIPNGWNASNPLQLPDMNVQEFSLKGGYKSNSWLNGHAIVNMSLATNQLTAVSLSVPQPSEIWMVLSVKTNGNGAFNYIYQASGSVVTYLRENTGVFGFYAAGTPITDTFRSIDTNKVWYVSTVIFDGANSRALTNNVLRVAGNAGTTQFATFKVGQDAGLCPLMDFAELIIYSATNSLVNQSNIFWALTNKYQLP